MKVSIIVVGKLKDKNLEAIEQTYLKRIPNLKIIEVKNEVDVLPKVKGDLYLLEEKGKLMDTPEFSSWLFNTMEKSEFSLVIGGASGHHESVLNAAKGSISLSPLTFPHKLARILLLEQIYRAFTVKEGHPYHK